MRSKSSSGMKWYCDLDGNNYLIYPEDKKETYIEGKFKKYYSLLKSISKKEVFKFYILELHNVADCIEYFNISRHEFKQICDYYNIHKNRDQLNSTNGKYQKIMWEAKPDSELMAYKEKQSKAHSTDEFKAKISKINKDYQANLPADVRDARNKQRSLSMKNAYKKDPTLYSRMKASRSANRKSTDKLCRSNAEQVVFDKLSEHYKVSYDLIVDDRYNYYIDFYIKELDLFIEYQGHPSHGRIPYDENIDETLDIATKMYGNWRDTYVKRDVEKSKLAVENKLNYLRIYPGASLSENYKINNYKFTNIIDIILK